MRLSISLSLCDWERVRHLTSRSTLTWFKIAAKGCTISFAIAIAYISLLLCPDLSSLADADKHMFDQYISLFHSYLCLGEFRQSLGLICHLFANLWQCCKLITSSVNVFCSLQYVKHYLLGDKDGCNYTSSNSILSRYPNP